MSRFTWTKYPQGLAVAIAVPWDGATRVVLARVFMDDQPGHGRMAVYSLQLAPEVDAPPAPGKCIAHGAVHVIDKATDEGAIAMAQELAELLLATLAIGAHLVEHVQEQEVRAAMATEAPASNVDEQDPDTGPVVH